MNKVIDEWITEEYLELHRLAICHENEGRLHKGYTDVELEDFCARSATTGRTSSR